ncbi:MAG TPA: hypothetical protein VM223_14590 [Planctomycetota bacterium]|nr:hypothetical protein [Planctomycetota bacterium]
METAEYTVARAFIDIDGVTKQPGWKVQLPLHRALVLYKAGFVAGPVYQQKPGEPWQAIHGSARRLTSREENVAGLESAILLANALKTTINEHYADATEHTAAPDTDNTIVSPQAGSLPTLITLVSEMMAGYVLHNADAIKVANWVYHAAQGTNRALASVVAPASLQECITRLLDVKAKYNLHEADAVSHGTGGLHPEATADAAYGAVVRIPIRGAKPTDLVSWGILDSGTGTVIGVRAAPGYGYVDFEFDADPENDCIISYLTTRKLP